MHIWCAMSPRRLVLVLMSAWLFSACASYTDTIRDTHNDIVNGNHDAAVASINAHLKVDDFRHIPDDLSGDRALLLLERATLLQSIGEYEWSSRDMIAADQHLEWLDFDRSTPDEIATYMYSASSGSYRAPAYERMLLNSLNMVNFMVLGQYHRARVEARRFALLQSFYAESEEDIASLYEILSMGNYLAGMAHEMTHDFRATARFYSDAWRYGNRSHALRERLVDVYRVTGFRPQDRDLDDIQADARRLGPMSVEEYRRAHLHGRATLIVQTGMVPYKVASRVPIGQASTYHSHHASYQLSSGHRTQLSVLSGRGVLRWVNFPVLSQARLPSTRNVSIFVDGRRYPESDRFNISGQVELAWVHVAGPMMMSAITRMITRAVAGEISHAAAREIGTAAGAAPGAAGVLGYLAGIAVESAMAAADTPDTRGWTTLPGEIRIVRLALQEGEHRVAVSVNGTAEERLIKMESDEFRVLNFSTLR